MTAYTTWVMIASCLLILIEIVSGRHRNVYEAGDFKILIGSVLLGRGVMAVIAASSVAAIYGWLLPAYEGSLAGSNAWLVFPLLLLADEFFFYWVHRFAHKGFAPCSKLDWLWKLHRTHHSGRHMNVLLFYRTNLFWYFVIPSAWVLGLAIYLGLGKAVLSLIVIKQAWNVITHSNFRWDDHLRRLAVIGKIFYALEHVIVSPGIHHTHHGYGKDGKAYRNFGVVLSLWDWLFGTLHIPEGRPAHYGIPRKQVHWLEDLCYPVVNFSRKHQANKT